MFGKRSDQKLAFKVELLVDEALALLRAFAAQPQGNRSSGSLAEQIGAFVGALSSGKQQRPDTNHRKDEEEVDA